MVAFLAFVVTVVLPPSLMPPLLWASAGPALIDRATTTAEATLKNLILYSPPEISLQALA